MAEARHILAIDQGTTSSRAIVFDADLAPVASARKELRQIYPRSGWVEHDPEEIWRDTLHVCRQAVAAARAQAPDLAIAGVGITNQRETVVLWERATGRPIHNAIVWQDRRTADICARLRGDGCAPTIQARTGLVVDPYFSGAKIAWLLDSLDGARAAAARGELACGTIDSWLVWKLTGGARHVTDATNAGRTMLFDIHRQRWDDDLLRMLDVPRSLLPEVLDCAADFGVTTRDLLDGAAAPICGVAGDQHAALIGQCCFEPGMIKSTYGTGCFALVNTGARALPSRNRLLTTMAYRLNGASTYAIEGSIFVAGAAVQWLRDGLKLFADARETAALAQQASNERSVVFVPAFVGLGAPYWDPDARGAIFGLGRETGVAEIVRAALEAVAFQTRDLLEAMAADGASPAELRVDGGMTANDWAMQFLADALGVAVTRPRNLESTALGAAGLAGLQCGLFGDLSALSRAWRAERKFSPAMGAARRDALYAAWKHAVARVRTGDAAIA